MSSDVSTAGSNGISGRQHARNNIWMTSNRTDYCPRETRLAHVCLGVLMLVEGLIIFFGNTITRSWFTHDHHSHHHHHPATPDNLPLLSTYNDNRHIASWVFTNGVCLGPLAIITGVLAILAGAMASHGCLIGSLAGDFVTTATAMHLSLIQRLKHPPINHRHPPHYSNLLLRELSPSFLFVCLFTCGHAVFAFVSLCSCRHLPLGRQSCLVGEYEPLANQPSELSANIYNSRTCASDPCLDRSDIGRNLSKTPVLLLTSSSNEQI